jgi:NAD(P)-dependent dehydrogenase (short-subunit alcohol dehydrogenase family)
MPSKVWFITGSSRGLGRRLAETVLANGDRLVATARRPEQLDDLVATYGDVVRAVALDVTDYAAAQAAVAAGLDAFGRLDVVVNNAGYADLASIEDITIEDFAAQIATNLMGVVNVTKAALPVLRQQGGGHILQVSSVGGRVATPGVGAYQAAKWGVGGFSEVLAAEVAPLGIKVTVLEPGGMDTDWAGSSMSVPPISEPYQATVGAIAEFMRGGSFVPLSDITKVAKVIMDVASMDEPPLRLLLGSEAYTYAAAAAAARAAADAANQAITASTDRHGATAADLDPLAR